MSDRQRSLAVWAGVACAALLALWLRSIWTWPLVFTPLGVDFQEPDAWFHLRTAHNLLAHFPFRSGFDPYALFPGGMNMPTGPLWDYMIATAAWIAGLGSPSSELADRVAAWLPAILGALSTIPVFWMARNLFGVTAGLFAALWVAVNAGEFLWLTHLGNADHHAAEGFFSILVFCFLCATELLRARRWPGILAGLSLGALLATQPAAIFVPGILAAAAMLAPSLAPAIVSCCSVAALVLLSAAGTPYTGFDWLSLAFGAATAGAVWGIELLHIRRGWPSWTRWAAAAIALALSLGVTTLLRPTLIPSLLAEVAYLSSSDVAELSPVVAPSWTLAKDLSEMNLHLGFVWIFALPGLIGAAVLAFRKGKAALALVTVASLAFTIAALMHMRMILYWTPFAAIGAGASCAWLLRLAARMRLRLALAAALAIGLVALNAPPVKFRMTFPLAGAGPDWMEALAWLRLHSPDPFGSPYVWSGNFPRRKDGERSSLAPPAYGVAAWWDSGYMIEELSHRIPMINGFGAGTDDKDAVAATRAIATFYSNTFADTAVNQLRRLHARYVIVDAHLPIGPGTVSRTVLPAMQKAAGIRTEDSVRLAWNPKGGALEPAVVYLENYYRSMGVRLYLTDGAAIHGTGPWVLQLKADPGGRAIIAGALHVNTAREAGEYIVAHPADNLLIGCLDSAVSCFDVDAVHGMHRVFSSDPLPIGPGRVISAVKIFEVEPDPAAFTQAQ